MTQCSQPRTGPRHFARARLAPQAHLLTVKSLKRCRSAWCQNASIDINKTARPQKADRGVLRARATRRFFAFGAHFQKGELPGPYNLQ